MLNAIVSVYNKEKLDMLGQILVRKRFNIYASKGTLQYLKKIGINAFPVEDIANNPIGYENYVSSLGFNSLMGILNDEKIQNSKHIIPIDVVVYNFVPTWDIIQDPLEFNIKNVDLGGPTMIRAAAINYKRSLPIVNPSQYELLEHFEKIDEKTRLLLAKTALEYCSFYDNKLVEFLNIQYQEG